MTVNHRLRTREWSGVDYYADAGPLVDKLVSLDMFVDIQVEHEQLLPFVPLFERTGVRVLVDHCGRPTIDAGLDQPGFRALLALGATTTRGPTSRRWSTRSRSIIACGRPTGLT